MALDLDGLVICGRCHELRDRDPRRPAADDGRVWCACPQPAHDPRPSGEAGLDAYELCYCCVAVLVRGGSKWANFFCRDCNRRVIDLNHQVGRCVIPIGRHSLMNGFGYNPNVPTHPSVEAFVDDLQGFLGGVETVWAWAKHWLVETLDAYGLLSRQDLPLRTYLAHAHGRDRGVGFSFEEMLEFVVARNRARS